jgi:hypothetical protein
MAHPPTLLLAIRPVPPPTWAARQEKLFRQDWHLYCQKRNPPFLHFLEGAAALMEPPALCSRLPAAAERLPGGLRDIGQVPSHVSCAIVRGAPGGGGSAGGGRVDRQVTAAATRGRLPGATRWRQPKNHAAGHARLVCISAVVCLRLGPSVCPRPRHVSSEVRERGARGKVGCAEGYLDCYQADRCATKGRRRIPLGRGRRSTLSAAGAPRGHADIVLYAVHWPRGPRSKQRGAASICDGATWTCPALQAPAARLQLSSRTYSNTHHAARPRHGHPIYVVV